MDLPRTDLAAQIPKALHKWLQFTLTGADIARFPGISVTAAAKGISFFIQRDVLSRHSGIINQKDRCRKAGHSSANDVAFLSSMPSGAGAL